jgi:predicted  nucleic acid-binding Zn-ribbon protein
MDAETRAAFERMDRYFELAQAQHEALRRDLAGISARMERLEERQIALEARQFALEARQVALEERQVALEARQVALEERQVALEERQVALEARQEQLDGSVAGLRVEMRERFLDMSEQFRTLVQRQDLSEERVLEELGGVSRQLAAVQDVLAQHGSRLQRLEVGVLDVNVRIDDLSSDMRQRFRLVHERLGAAA